MVQATNAATPQTTITALRGCPSAETWETQPEKGRTPSRATAKTRREAATMAIAVFFDNQHCAKSGKKDSTYKPQGDDADDVHEDMTPLS